MAVFDIIVTACPFKVTEVAPVKLEPEIVTVAPTTALKGLTAETTGKVVMVNGVKDTAVPPAVVTLITPDVAPAGTVAVMVLSSFTTNSALVPLKVTDVAPVNAEPNIVVVPPTPPWSGVKKVIVGIGTTTVKLVALVPVPNGVVTAIGPVVAPTGITT